MALTDCLSDWVGLRGTCTAETPGSGLYINDLPGIQIGFMENLSNSEQATFKDVWERVERRGLQTFAGAVRRNLRPDTDFKTIASSISTGEWDNDGSTTQGDVTKTYGYRIDPVKSKYMALYLNYVSFYSDSVATIPIRVYNLSTGATLYSNDFTAAIGINTFNVNQEFSFLETEAIFIGFQQGAGFEGIKVDEWLERNEGRGMFNGQWGAITTASTPVDNNFESSGTEPYCMVLNFNILCSMNNYICQHRQPLSVALWYWLGYEFMQEWIAGGFGKNVNYSLTVNADQKKEWRDMFRTMAEEELVSIVGRIRPEVDGVCFECSPALQFKHYVP